MNAFIDASVLLRKLFGEPDALKEWSEIEKAYASRLLPVEVGRVIDRCRLNGMISDEQVAELHEEARRLQRAIDIAPLTDRILGRAAGAMPTAIGTLEAIHLSTLVELVSAVDSQIVFCTLIRSSHALHVPPGFESAERSKPSVECFLQTSRLMMSNIARIIKITLCAAITASSMPSMATKQRTTLSPVEQLRRDRNGKGEGGVTFTTSDHTAVVNGERLIISKLSINNKKGEESHVIFAGRIKKNGIVPSERMPESKDVLLRQISKEHANRIEESLKQVLDLEGEIDLKIERFGSFATLDLDSTPAPIKPNAK